MAHKMAKKKSKYLIIALIGFLVVWGGEEFFRRVIGGFAGSYPYAQTWDFIAAEDEVLAAIKELKKENPSLQPPNQEEYPMTRDTGYIWNSDEMIEYVKKLQTDSLTPLPEKNYDNSYHDYWIFVDFYYPDTKEVLRTWTRPDFNPNITTFALVSIDDRLINKDFWYLANKREIRKFRKNIVDKIQQKIDQKRKRGED